MSRIAKVGTLALGAGAVVLGLPGVAAADADAKAAAHNSPGTLSGNVIQVPIHLPLNVCGNTVTVFGGLNRAAGSVCENNEGEKKSHKKHEARGKHDKKHADKQHKAHDKKSDKKDHKAHAEKDHKKDVKKHDGKQHKAHDGKHDKKDVKKHAEKLLQGYGL
ncbi:chaplin [Streptomyces sp. NPDC019990]|uniref:chaplin n=1 Tax=Streptomyces sp. NPDC019990 TaxID=3154693 RepID=UPI0033EEE777